MMNPKVFGHISLGERRVFRTGVARASGTTPWSAASVRLSPRGSVRRADRDAAVVGLAGGRANLQTQTTGTAAVR